MSDIFSASTANIPWPSPVDFSFIGQITPPAPSVGPVSDLAAIPGFDASGALTGAPIATKLANLTPANQVMIAAGAVALGLLMFWPSPSTGSRRR